MDSGGKSVAVSDVVASETAPASGVKPSERRLRLCLAASGGGHVRQLLDLESVWSKHDYFFVTEDTALGTTLAETHRTHFVPHVALGQARLGAPWRMIRAGVSNFFRSASIIAHERPDIVISTGAGAVFFAVVWARLRGARTVVIDSFARFDRPSMFARIAAPIADDLVVQSKALGSHFPKAKVFDPFRLLDTPPPPKKPLLFATVGATLPFERLVSSVAELKARGGLSEEVIVQTGVGAPQPQGVTAIETLPFDRIQQLLTDADIVVCHGGTGSLITALRQGCRVIAFPRLLEKGEHYDNHQAEITGAFAARGLIEVANDADELAAAIARIKARPPVLATTDPSELIAYLDGVLDEERRRRRPRTQKA
ncbi:beta-1,4-glucuronosyltransferase WelK [Phenylobacterium sp.]|uniref:beta-1,4-glucuronosyltransferase WelK n=1 Tax=Phenylobacterium sp. TaxID=1871053 RepID=UPI0035AE7607